ncbi:AraC family transcriptional regulator [Undibacterium pigrum]|uniref:AraC family transcriptional regulator n=1 Tax=Undibacterium pigrum TaxID=401470 RepID=A0A318JDA9_9BURK|nr:AraC family transcriptional regulator [Undibacterium pigrum]PXX45054.1 AraC family transcriptional regulator [Undibacterium pigrum]
MRHDARLAILQSVREKSLSESNYQMRMLRVLQYIDAHLDEDLTLERLSAVAAFSKFHFHRQFSDYFGLAAFSYVQLLRLKKAMYELAFRSHKQVIAIALDNGYESSEAFSRAFKKSLGLSPAQFRKQPQWDTWQHSQLTIDQLREQHMPATYQLTDVRITDFPETRIAVLEHRGAPALLGNSIQQFIAWRKLNKLPPSVSATFNLIYDDPDQTPADEYRFDLGAAVPAAVTDNQHGIVNKLIPAGKCAVLRHTGTDAQLGSAVRFLYNNWLPQSQRNLRDFPLFFQRISFFPDVPEHLMVTDIFLPLQE